MSAERWNLLHPTEPRRKSYVETRARRPSRARSIAATDYMRNYADQVREHVQAPAGATSCSAPTASAAATTARSCASFFEVDRHYVAVAALKALADDGAIKPAIVAKAIAKYGLDTERPRSLDRVSLQSRRHTSNELVMHRHQGSRHRRLQGRAGHRGLGQARRHGEGRRPLVSLESDKATMDVPSPLAGVVKAVDRQGRRQGQRRQR